MKKKNQRRAAGLARALCIGATTAVFSVIHAALMNPYSYAGANPAWRQPIQPLSCHFSKPL